ncbi:MAG: protein phosphatase 2C domain-containing protein [Massilibacteroides sp.]|nr:protein phosphatase 2C domain-containing protein [Massilibacteroides sp.]MDD3061357.1 protein phosphatase 2C domain-containing protein [Massilibacteroides sp.]MDD4114653.1 protein phosphatase 2C domain-containing protein [Massilibacteroides sp.]MDD4659448.1 protein phosphatase 2C domain-containing protein [Massilibacteroides sp.]
MHITIGKPYAASEKGGRANNEDFIFPAPEAVGTNQKLFIVCDGVGGANKGEVASAMACECFYSFLSSFFDGYMDAAIINKALQYTEVNFDEYIRNNPEAIGMGTTLALLFFSPKGITVAHIGDTRIYHFRNGRILHQTEDHSLVYSLYKLNTIKKEEMRTHPQRNIILRAIQGNDNPTEAEVNLLTDIKDGDFLFMCTDGVFEVFTDDELSELFNGQHSAEECKDILIETCNGETKDNFSFYIIPVQHVRESESLTQNILSFFYSLV